MEERNEETGNDDKDKEIILDDAQEEKNKTEDMHSEWRGVKH